MPPHRHAYRPTVMGTRGVVTSAHPLASMAGIQMLQAGGNAVDAAVAVGSTLNVVEPFMSSAAGIGLMLISRGRTGERHVLDFIGRAPRASDPAACTDDELAGGPKSCATPGNLGGWLAALDRFGSMDRVRVLAPAISLAEDGVPLTFKNVEFFDKARAALARSQEAQRLYLGNGGPRAGGIATYKELASMLRQVAEGGAEAFYRGPIARAIARAVREAGGWLTEDDLAGFAPEWREPVAITYRGWQVLSVPPFSAFQMLETLNILEGYDLESFRHNSVDYLHHLIEAVKLGSADRLAYAYGADVPIHGLLSKPYAASQRARIDGKRAAVSEGERHDPRKLAAQIVEGHPADFMHEQTTHFACADAAGTVVSVTPDARRAVRLRLCGSRHRNRPQQHSQVDGPRPGVAERPAARAESGHDDVAHAGFPGRGLQHLHRHPRLVRDLADHAADAPQRARVRHEHPGGDRGAARACLSRSVDRRGVAHSGRDALGPRRTRPQRQPYRRLVVDRRRWTGNRPRPGIRRADGGS